VRQALAPQWPSQTPAGMNVSRKHSGPQLKRRRPINHRHMRGHDLPANIGEAHPGLHLAADHILNPVDIYLGMGRTILLERAHQMQGYPTLPLDALPKHRLT